MSASPPFLAQRPYDSLSILEACQREPFGNELLQVDTSLVTRLDPVIVQCSRYSSLQYKEVKGYKSYGTDKGRLLYLSAYTRDQTWHGYLKLSRQEQITILFLMALYRPDKEGRSSEPVADAVETCSTNEHSDSDSPHQISTTDYIMNRHGLSANQNLVEEIHNKISLIKDNVSKYFTADFDKGNDCYYYYNTLLMGQDYTNETVFIDLIPKITTKTKTAPKVIFGRVKPEGRTTLKKRRTTISQTPVNRNIAPHLASAENRQIREIPTEPAALDNGNLAVYPQQPTPSYEGEYQMDEYSTPNFTPVNNFGQIQQQISQPMPNVAHQEPGAYGAYGSVNVTHLYNTINMLLGMFETATGKSYSEFHAFQQQQFELDTDVDEIFGDATTEQYHNMNMPTQQVTMAHPQQLQGFPQFNYSNNNNVRFEHQNNTHSSSSG